MTTFLKYFLAGMFLMSSAVVGTVAQAADSDDDEAIVIESYQSDTLSFDPAASQVAAGKEGAVGNLVSGLGYLFISDATDPVTIVLRITFVILTLLGAGFLGLLIYAGFLWLTAQGNDEQIGKAKEIIKRSIIGFVIIFGALSIASMTFYLIAQTVGTTGTSPVGDLDSDPDDITIDPIVEPTR